jgi:hypothetical protein
VNQDELFLSLLDVPVRVPTATPDGDAQAIDWATHGPLAGNHGHKPGLAALALAAGAGGLAAVRGQRERVLDHLVIDLQRGREYWRVLKDVRGLPGPRVRALPCGGVLRREWSPRAAAASIHTFAAPG